MKTFFVELAILHRPNLGGVVDDSLAPAKPHGQLKIVARRTHGDGDRLSILARSADSYGQRLFGGHAVRTLVALRLAYSHYSDLGRGPTYRYP